MRICWLLALIVRAACCSDEPPIAPHFNVFVLGVHDTAYIASSTFIFHTCGELLGPRYCHFYGTKYVTVIGLIQTILHTECCVRLNLGERATISPMGKHCLSTVASPTKHAAKQIPLKDEMTSFMQPST